MQCDLLPSSSTSFLITVSVIDVNCPVTASQLENHNAIQLMMAPDSNGGFLPSFRATERWMELAQ